MNDWKEVKLGECVEINRKNISNNFEGEILYVDISSVNQGILKEYTNFEFKDAPSRARRIVKNNDIIFSTVRPNLKAYYKFNENVPDNMVVSTGFVVLSEQKNTSIDFIYYYVIGQSFIDYLNNVAKGTAYPAVNVIDFKNAKIKIPVVDTQVKIANVLSTYDKLIENNNRRIEVLEQTAEEIYKEWFVRMRFSGYENTKFVKGIPEGWKVKKIGDIFNVTSSKRVYSSDYVESGIPFYRSKEVIKLSNGEAVSELLHISDNKYEEFKKKFGVPQKNDILITSVGTIGIPLLITDDNPFYFKDGNLTWIQSSLNPVLSFYLYYWLKSDMGYRSLQMYTIGTSQSALTITNLKRLKLLLPNETVLHKFNDIFGNLNMKMNYLNQQNQNLIKQRDLLLPRLMNGTIEVK